MSSYSLEATPSALAPQLCPAALVKVTSDLHIAKSSGRTLSSLCRPSAPVAQLTSPSSLVGFKEVGVLAFPSRLCSALSFLVPPHLSTLDTGPSRGASLGPHLNVHSLLGDVNLQVALNAILMQVTLKFISLPTNLLPHTNHPLRLPHQVPNHTHLELSSELCHPLTQQMASAQAKALSPPGLSLSPTPHTQAIGVALKAFPDTPFLTTHTPLPWTKSFLVVFFLSILDSILNKQSDP